RQLRTRHLSHPRPPLAGSEKAAGHRVARSATGNRVIFGGSRELRSLLRPTRPAGNRKHVVSVSRRADPAASGVIRRLIDNLYDSMKADPRNGSVQASDNAW